MSDQAESVLIRALRMWPGDPGRVLFRSQEAIHYLRHELLDPVIDVGGGNGQFARLIQAEAAIGVDRNISLLKKARLASAYQRYICCDITELPFGNGVFATAVANSTLEHVVDIELACQEIYRVLRPGGRLLMTMPLTAKREWLGFGDTEYGAPRGDLVEAYKLRYDRRWTHRHYLTASGVSSLLKRSGFATVMVKEYEARSTSNLIDALSHIRVRMRHATRTPLEHYVAERTYVFWARLMVSALEDVPDGEGACAFFVAGKASSPVSGA